MKNFCVAVKIFVIGLLFSSVMIFSENCSAAVDYYSRSITQLDGFVGNWYDSNGNLVLSISNDYKVNGCKILSYASDGEYWGHKIRIDEGNRYSDIEFHISGSWGISDYHEVIVLNEKTPLRRTKNPRYIESVGGIYLGMDKNQVVSKYGQPSKVENRGRYSVWTYNREGFELGFEWNLVTGIEIYNYGDRKFDWSGLSAKNSKSDFEYKYNGSFSRRGNLNIGHGELINFSNGKVSLRIFTPGYVF